jgi:hypothetical protein
MGVGKLRDTSVQKSCASVLETWELICSKARHIPVYSSVNNPCFKARTPQGEYRISQAMKVFISRSLAKLTAKH